MVAWYMWCATTFWELIVVSFHITLWALLNVVVVLLVVGIVDVAVTLIRNFFRGQ